MNQDAPSGRIKRAVRKFLLWPKVPGDPRRARYRPWWAIAWLMLWLPVMAVGAVILLVAMTCAEGPRAAAATWGSLR